MASLENYATPDNLLARISIHGYATDPNWMSWLFEHEMPAESASARILDIGCGTGALWSANRDRIDPSWEITLADSSPGMVREARRNLGDTFTSVVADIDDLPFAADSFDVALANHMLYHVPDRPVAFMQVSRVLRPGGHFHCSANGRDHLRQLAELVPNGLGLAPHAETFGLETGPAQVSKFFSEIRVTRFENSLRVPTADPVLAYIRSSERYTDSIDLDAIRKTVEAEIARDGAFLIDTHPGLISCRNP